MIGIANTDAILHAVPISFMISFPSSPNRCSIVLMITPTIPASRLHMKIALSFVVANCNPRQIETSSQGRENLIVESHVEEGGGKHRHHVQENDVGHRSRTESYRWMIGAGRSTGLDEDRTGYSLPVLGLHNGISCWHQSDWRQKEQD